MISLLAALIFSQTATGEPCYRVPRAGASCGYRSNGRSGGGAALALTSFLAFSDTGSSPTTSCACSAVTDASGLLSLTVARSTAAYCTAEDYSLVSCPANTPRIMTGRGATGPHALYTEKLGENEALWARDLSQVAWTKSASMSCAKTATGVDNAATSASTCTSSGTNQTVTQTVVNPSALTSNSAYVRRRTGTGAVSTLAPDGVTYLDITGQLTSSWKRAVCLDTEGCSGGRCLIVPGLCATATNPLLGFKIAVSGDAIDVDFAQQETAVYGGGFKPSSPMASTSSKASRGADVASMSLPSTFTHLSSFSAAFWSSQFNVNEAVVELYRDASMRAFIWNSGTATPQNQGVMCGWLTPTLGSMPTNTFHPGGGYTNVSCKADSANVWGGMAGQTTAAVGSTIGWNATGLTTVYFSATTLSGNGFAGLISNVCASATDITACDASTTHVYPAATHIAWLGDSITYGGVYTAHRPPYDLYKISGQYVSKSVQNFGVGGANVQNISDLWNTNVKTQRFGTAIILGGVNDLRGGAAASTIYATLKGIYDDVRARGMNLVVLAVTPWGNYVQWNASNQTQTLALNQGISDYCADAGAASCTFVDTYTALKAKDGGVGLADIYDGDQADGGIHDGLHPGTLGSCKITVATAVAAFGYVDDGGCP